MKIKNELFKDWKIYFRSAYGSAFKDETLIESCILWIENLIEFGDKEYPINATNSAIRGMNFYDNTSASESVGE